MADRFLFSPDPAEELDFEWVVRQFRRIGDSFYTVSDEYVEVAGDTMTGDLTLNDNVRLRFGNSGEATIHYGSNLLTINPRAGGGSADVILYNGGLKITDFVSENTYGLQLDADNAGGQIQFGEGQDASIYWDSTDLVIDPTLQTAGGVKIPAHVAMGADGVISNISVIDVDETIDPAGSQGAGLRFDVDMNTSIPGSKITSLGATITNTNSDVFGSAQIWGMDIQEQQNGPNGLVSMFGLYTKGGSAASTGTIASYAGVVIATPTFAVKPNISDGIVVNNQGQSNTRTTGITVAQQTNSLADVYGIVLAGDNDGGNIVFGIGKDATIYYNSTDLIIDPDLIGTGKVLIGATGDDDMKLNAIEIDGDLNHDGSNIGFFGTTPIAKQTTTSQTPAAFTANTSGIADDTATWNGYTIGDVVAILQAYGLLT